MTWTVFSDYETHVDLTKGEDWVGEQRAAGGVGLRGDEAGGRKEDMTGHLRGQGQRGNEDKT